MSPLKLRYPGNLAIYASRWLPCFLWCDLCRLLLASYESFDIVRSPDKWHPARFHVDVQTPCAARRWNIQHHIRYKFGRVCLHEKQYGADKKTSQFRNRFNKKHLTGCWNPESRNIHAVVYRNDIGQEKKFANKDSSVRAWWRVDDFFVSERVRKENLQEEKMETIVKITKLNQ